MHSVSTPAQNAAMTSAPVLPRCSAIANTVGATGTVGWAEHLGMDIVVVVRMARCAVEPGGLADGCLVGAAEELRLGVASSGCDFRCEQVGEGFARTGQRDAREVH